MANTESLLLVGTIEPVEVGEIFESTPLHVTILPWFSFAKDKPSGFEDKMQYAIKRHLPIEIIGYEEAMFGPENDIRVRKISSKAIHLLHNELLGLVEGLGVDIGSNWVGPNYAPHVSYKGEKGVGESESVQLRALQLFSRTSKESQRIVKEVYE